MEWYGNSSNTSLSMVLGSYMYKVVCKEQIFLTDWFVFLRMMILKICSLYVKRENIKNNILIVKYNF